MAQNNTMHNTFIPFALPEIGTEEIEEVVHALKSGWVTTGPKTKQFEQEFATFVGEDVHAVAVNSATAGLHLALEAVGIQAGDEVITTTHTFTATAEVIRYLGAHPVLVDIDSQTLNIDPMCIESAITSNTKAIIVVHFAGLACDMEQILAIAKRHQLKVIEDAAHAFPTLSAGKLIGSLDSDATIYSFYATKTITTGEGGMIVTKHKEIADRCRTMRLHGINRDVFDRYTSNKPSWFYQVVAPGYKYNLTDIASSMGIQQLKKAWKFRQRRAEMAQKYNAGLGHLPLRLPPSGNADDTHAWHLYVIRLLANSPLGRDEFISKMAESGIGCSVHFIPLHLHPYWRDTYHLEEDDFPNSFETYQNCVSLPIYTKMSDEDQEYVIKTVQKLLSV